MAALRLPVPQQAVKALYARPPSFTDLLPWTDYAHQWKTFLLDDGISQGAAFEIQAVGSEARTQDFMDRLRDSVQTALCEAIPEKDAAPWVLQVYLQDEALDPALIDYASAPMKDTALGQAWREEQTAHVKRIAADGGLFFDHQVTGAPWRGQVRRVRAVLYRRIAPQEKTLDPTFVAADLNDVAQQFTAALGACDIELKRLDACEFYRWLLPWFNPSKAGEEPAIKTAPYPGDDRLPFGRDFAQTLVLGRPASDQASGTWWFNDQPHTVVSLQGLRRRPNIGHMTAENNIGEHVYALFDRAPADTIMAITITFPAQDRVRDQVGRVRHAAVGEGAEATLAREDASAAERQMAMGDKLLNVAVAFYLKAENLEALRQRSNQLNSLLLPNGLQPILRDNDLLALDTYIRHLPMAYDPSLDRLARRSRYMFASDLAALLPVYGRSRGTGNPGLVFYNRGAEPLTFDPLSRADREKNAHLLVLGPTGSGKSALLVYLLQQMMAHHRPRLFIIEAGGSFHLLGQYFAKAGLSVNELALNPGSTVSLPPFSEAKQLLTKRHQLLRMLNTSLPPVDEDTESDENNTQPDANRDVLGEMELIARLMITGGDEQEDRRLTRADRLLIRQAIVRATLSVDAANKPTVLTEHVVDALRNASAGSVESVPDRSRNRAADMADAMALFCSGLAGDLFNRPGQSWPDTDVTILEMGTLARDGYEDQLNVAYVSMMSHINALVERCQNDARPTLVVTDEGHIITTNPLLSRYVVKITKMWRKLGAWFWIATQNLEDFPQDARRMLNMIEWWLCLCMPKEEIDQIARFRELSEEQRALLRSARKSPGEYVEGVVLSDKVEALFRNVPPPLSLALAMTEKDEKAQRAAVMKEHDCSELEAVQIIAQAIAEKKP